MDVGGISITNTYRWSMGHRILGLVGPGAKCANVHGHNWTAEVELPNDDQTLEFGSVKATIQEFIDTRWDHGFMVHAADPFLRDLDRLHSKYYAVDSPPTTEVIAAELAAFVAGAIGVPPLRVHIIEGYRNAATWTLHHNHGIRRRADTTGPEGFIQ